MTLHIDKHKPIPRPPQGALSRDIVEAFSSMEVGDSFLLPERSRQTLNTIAREVGVEIEVRVEANDLRVWLKQRL